MKLCLILGLFLSFSAAAEYRAYRLNLRNQETGAERLVLSTLDPDQYVGYYPLGRNEVVEYVTSWRCRGSTAHFRRICPNPKINGPDTAPKPNSAVPRSGSDPV